MVKALMICGFILVIRIECMGNIKGKSRANLRVSGKVTGDTKFSFENRFPPERLAGTNRNCNRFGKRGFPSRVNSGALAAGDSADGDTVKENRTEKETTAGGG